jgi:primosomal protein N' (replication factor Y) (superfamily II helicase)
LAKGHDLHGITLAVIADADEGLHSIDPRASERMAQLIVQVAGRAGRGHQKGSVLIQTRQPEHGLFKTLLHGGYAAFAREELALRQTLSMPPYAAQALLRGEARERDLIEQFLSDARTQLAAHAVHVAGPMPAPHARRAGYERLQLLIEHRQRAHLQDAIQHLLPLLYKHPLQRRLRWSMDVDPVSFD